MRPSAPRELDFDAILDLVAAHTRTRVGRFLVFELNLSLDRQTILDRCDLTAEMAGLVEDGGQLALTGGDECAQWLEPGTQMPFEPKDLLILLAFARRIVSVRRRLMGGPEALVRLRRIGEGLADTSELVKWAAPRLGRDGRVPDDASPELARLRRSIGRVRQGLVAELEGIRRGHPGVATDAPPTLKRDRYCIPVRSSARAQLPGLVLDSSNSGATAYVEPYATVELNNQLAETIAGERGEVRRILAEVAAAFSALRQDLAEAVHVLGQLDAVQARVLFGQHNDGQLVWPGGGERLVLRGARHPLLDERLHGLRLEVLGDRERREPGRDAVPLDFRFPDETKTLVISGPNAGGKTVVLKTIGLMVLMCYQSIPIPVENGTVVPWFDHLWWRIGDDQSVSADLSTFSGAMTATARLLDKAGPGSLVIFDELGTGTDPLEGAALGCALLEELTARGCRTVASTHLAVIALAASSNDGMANAAMEYDEVGHRPTYGLRIGRPGRSRGVEIAASVGVAPKVIDRARQLLGGQHLELEHWLEKLERLETEVVREREAAAGVRLRLEGERREVEGERSRLEEDRAEVPRTLQKERDALRQRAKKKLDQAIIKLREATKDHHHLGRRAVQKLRDQALDLATSAKSGSETISDLVPGMQVRIRSNSANGVLQTVRGTEARVAVSGKRLWVAVADLEVADSGTAGKGKPRRIEIEVEETLDRELMLLGLDSEEARERVERFLDRSHAGGVATVRIVHGHGTGTLRRMVSEVLRSHPAVVSFAHPPGNRGGTGATEVTLEQ